MKIKEKFKIKNLRPTIAICFSDTLLQFFPLYFSVHNKKSMPGKRSSGKFLELVDLIPMMSEHMC